MKHNENRRIVQNNKTKKTSLNKANLPLKLFGVHKLQKQLQYKEKQQKL